MNKFYAILKNSLLECEKHSKRLNRAYSKVYTILPFTAENVLKLSEDEIGYIDQFLFRFAKLQDVIGERLFPSMLQFLGESTEKKSFIDIFNRLEQIEAVRNYDTWINLRLIRNELSHEYDDEPAKNAEKLNTIFNSKNDLEKYFEDIKNYLKRFKEFN